MIGPGAYNPEIEAIKSKARTMIIYRTPKNDKKLATDKIYQYINEIKSINKTQSDYNALTYKGSMQRKNNALMWRKPKEKEMQEEDNSPGPGTYNAIDTLIAQNPRTITFGTQERTIRLLNKDNNFIVKTSNDEKLPEVGSYFKKTHFRWKADPYPSI